MKSVITVIFAFIFFNVLFAQVDYEICGNGIDDDGNGLVDEACEAFNCNGALFQTVGNTLNRMSLDPVSFTEITGFDKRVNGTGYNPQDNLIYSFLEYSGSDNSHLIRIDKNGDYSILGRIRKEDGSTIDDVFAADFGKDGVFYVLDQGSYGGKLYALDIETRIAKEVLATDERMTDIAFNPVNEKLYGISDSKYLHELDPVAGTDTNLGRLTGIANMNNGSVGATYFTLTGELVTYGVWVGYNQDDLVIVDINSVSAVMKEQDAVENSSMDGCSCPYTVKLEKSVSDTMVEPGGSFTYRFEIFNRTGFTVDGIDLLDTLDPRLTITGIVSNDFGAFATGGVGTNHFRINDLTVPVGSQSMEITVQLEDGEYCPGFRIPNQAMIEGIPVINGEKIVSDDPATLKEWDTTWINIKPNVFAVPGTFNIDDISVCQAVDTILRLDDHQGDLSWEQSDDGIDWIPYQGTPINDTTLHITQEHYPDSTVNKYYRAKVVHLCDTQFVDLKVTTRMLPDVDLGEDAVIYGQQYLNASYNFDTYRWNTGDINNYIYVFDPGVYSVTVTEDGCSNADTIVFSAPEPILLSADDTSACKGDTVMLESFNGEGYYSWQMGGIDPTGGKVFEFVAEKDGEIEFRRYWENYQLSLYDYGGSYSNTYAFDNDLNRTYGSGINSGQYETLTELELTSSDGTRIIKGPTNDNGFINVFAYLDEKTVYFEDVYVSDSKYGIDFWLCNTNPDLNEEHSVSVYVDNVLVREIILEPDHQWHRYQMLAYSEYSYYAKEFEIRAGNKARFAIDEIAVVQLSNTYHSEEVAITVNDFTMTPFPADTLVCAGESLQLGVDDIFNHYSWNTGDTVNQITADTAGSYILHAYTGGCSFIDTTLVHVETLSQPKAALAVDDTLLCLGSAANIYVKDSMDLGQYPIYNWFVNDQLIDVSAGSFILDSLTETADLTLELIADKHCTEDSVLIIKQQISVEQSPLQGIAGVDTSVRFCAGQELQLIADMAGSMGAGSSSAISYDWYINGNLQSDHGIDFTAPALQPGDVLAVSIQSGHICAADGELKKEIIINPLPQPKIIAPEIACMSTSMIEISAVNTGMHAGNFSLVSGNGVTLINDTAYFQPDSAVNDFETISILWTDTLGCTQTAEHIFQLADAAEPVAGQTSYSAVWGINYDQEMSVDGSGETVRWYDENMNLLSEGPESYTPDHSCNANECIYTFYATLEDPVNACESKAVRLSYTVSGCRVPSPDVADQLVCLGQSYTLHADTADISAWISDVPEKQSTLFWYDSLSTDYSSFVHQGLTAYAADKTQAGSYSFWVRQYNPVQNCYSSAKKLVLDIWDTEAPAFEQQTYSFCDNEPIILSTSQSDTDWYMDADGDEVLQVQSPFAELELASGTHFVHVQRSQHGCSSEMLSQRIEVLPSPDLPAAFDAAGCQLQQQHFLVARHVDGQTVHWYTADDNTEIASGDTLFLDEEYLSLGENTFKLLAENEQACRSDMQTVQYELIHTPRFRSFSGDTVICQGTEMPTFTYTSTDAEHTVWYDSTGTVLSREDSLIPDSLPAGLHYFAVAGQYRNCALDSFHFPIRVIESPVFSIVGDSLFCEQTIGQKYTIDEHRNMDRLYWEITGDREFSAIDTYHWEYGIQVNWLEPGIDTIFAQAVNNEGCMWTDSLTVLVGYPTDNDFDAEADNATMSVSYINTSEQYYLEGIVPFETDFWWEFEDAQEDYLFQPYLSYVGDSVIERKYPYGYHTTTLYSLNNFGCRDTVIHDVFVDLDHALYIPDAFYPHSPSGALNAFRVVGYNLASFELTIFDNWGNTVWYTNKLENGCPAEFWDGQVHDLPIAGQTYMWKIKAKFLDGTIWPGRELTNGKYRKFGSLIVMQ